MTKHTRQIKRIYVRRYRDTGQVAAYVDWADGSRAEGTLWQIIHRGRLIVSFGDHMHALLARAKAAGLRLERETW